MTLLNYQAKTVCKLHVSEWFGSGWCDADVHTNLLESGLPYTAISIYRSGTSDLYHPLATVKVTSCVVAF